MKKVVLVRLLFFLAAVYDGVLGAIFLIKPMFLFERFEITPPNHPGYVQFPAMLLIIFSIMFINIALNPFRNRNLIWYGVLLKISYCTAVFYYWFTSGIPVIWKPFAVIDLFFIVLFVLAWCSLRQQRS